MTLPSNIVRITAPNAGPFTGDGTNTYLVGTEKLAVIDPGPDDPAHMRAILAAATGRPITHILATHAHRDHVDGVSALRVATGAHTAGYQRGDVPSHAATAADSASGGDFIDWNFKPDIALADGSIFEAGDMRFETVHTPGHAPDHLCFALTAHPHILFSGDHVMGWSTSVIAPPEGNMGDYLSSLEQLLISPQTLYLPGHGAAIPDGARTARAYLLHRRMRERSVLDAIDAGALSIPAIADIVYAGIAPNLRNAARLSIAAHLELLAQKRLISYDASLRMAERIVVERPA